MRLIAALFAAWLACAPANAQLTATGVGGGFGESAASYTGPGDVVSGATAFYSIARVYNAAAATTSTNLADLVDIAGTAVCTLRGSSTGFVDLAASYCGGSTPSVKCAAQTGGKCYVNKLYNQVSPGTLDLNTVAASRNPPVDFSAVNGLPTMTFASVNATVLASSASMGAQSQPFTWVGVAKRTNTAQAALLDSLGSGGVMLGWDNTANKIALQSNTPLLTRTASDTNYHTMIGVANGASNSIIVGDGTATTGNAGTTGISGSTTMRIGRDSSGFTLTGSILEAGLWPSGFDATQYGNMDANQRSTNGYCGTNGCTLP